VQLLFIQGGGEGAHDEWDGKLVDDLRRRLGEGYEVRYPRMPAEGDPGYATWSVAIRREIAGLNDRSVVAGHSVGATVMIQTIAEQPPGQELAMILLTAAPFVGQGGWPGGEFELPGDLGARLPGGVPVHVFHGLDDETVPASHADLYARAIPQAQVHLLCGRDHQLNNDLGEVARVISSSSGPPQAGLQGRDRRPRT
jgi:pimeloyl-ACP methyl ester carboxylesterase